MIEYGGRRASDGRAQAPLGRAEREVRDDTPLRRARTCYNHLAGVAGVGLLDEMVRRGWLVPGGAAERSDYTLTPEGAAALARRGVDLAAARTSGRRFAYGCPDWTEGRPHLSGALASEILKALGRRGVIERRPGSRAVRQHNSLASWLDAWDASQDQV
jgi:hypothetical protein